MTAPTKETLLHKHRENTMLTAQTPSATRQHDHDASADDIAAPLDETILAATVDALEAGNTHYVDVPGIPPLRQALAAYLQARTGAGLQQSNIVVTAGVQESRFLTIQMVGQEFDRIAIPKVVHPGVHKAIGVRPKPVVKLDVAQNTLLPTLEAIRTALADGARLVYLESPSRLTGAAYDAESCAAIAAAAGEYQATVIWDQGLAPWSTQYTSLASRGGLADQLLLIGEAFPGTGLSSWFIGFIAAPEAMVPPMQSQKQIMAICTSTPAQYAALQASTLYNEAQPRQMSRLEAKRQNAAARLTTAGVQVLPGTAATVLAIRLAPDAKQAALTRLSSAGYTVADGANFGAPDVLRLTISHESAAEDAVAIISG